jgi:hypothetical protein
MKNKQTGGRLITLSNLAKTSSGLSCNEISNVPGASVVNVFAEVFTTEFAHPVAERVSRVMDLKVTSAPLLSFTPGFSQVIRGPEQEETV